MHSETANIVLSVRVEKTRFVVDETIVCTFMLTNSSAYPLWVNKRMVVNSVNAPACFRDMWIDIQNPRGQKLSYLARIRVGMPVFHHYVNLPPGNSVVRAFELSKYFDLTEPGLYAMIANYQDGNPDVPAPPEGVKHFNQHIRSELLEFVVAPAT